MILSFVKIVIIFNISSAEIKIKSADVSLKMTTILKELRIAQLRSKNKRTLVLINFNPLCPEVATYIEDVLVFFIHFHICFCLLPILEMSDLKLEF